MTESAITIEGLHFSYGKKQVLKGVDLEVPKGSIFGFLGRNGTGKTTTIKTLLGLQKPRSGRCIIGGLDSFTETLEVRRRIGFMAEDQQMYGWMTISRIIKWVAGFYPGWDYKFADELADMLGLPKNTKVKALSKGQNSSLALLLALGHRPDIVILDDPTLGLDPIARKDFLRHVIELLQSNGVTVFFSSHLLYEIEPVADHIAILDKGVIIKASRTEQLRESVRKFVLTPKPEANFSEFAGILDVLKVGGNVSITVEDCDDEKRTQLKGMSTNGMTEVALNLDEIFEAYVIGNRGRELSV
ncbi:MAG: ABC transporter ATP-binding protein [Planctomycetes bacterium]|nr:ABC transporter ATP-binding protein [Planctomycetota bacterium]MBL7144826.1 ABC transporter ATP-binding protein [Phycisphaerae bacterium]